MDRRRFLGSTTAGSAGLVLGLGLPCLATESVQRKPYQGPNVILIRFGGGVRRQETIAADAEYAPFLKHVLAPGGVLFPDMEIASRPGIATSHGEGTLNLLTGKYDVYEDVDKRFLGARFEAKVPTLFEGLRKAFDLPEHQALIINGEDRIDEEFYSFSNHHLFGVDYRSTVLSLYRFKLYLLRRDLAEGRYRGAEAEAQAKELARLESLDVRARDARATSPQMDAFWEKWSRYYGRSGFVNPRGDRLLAELAIWAMRELQPRLMIVNFNDTDYVHWGNKAHYTLGVTIVDESLRRVHEEAARLEFYRDRTIFVVVPDCGRDNNPLVAVPYQHHFNTKSAHQIFGVVSGPGIERGRMVDKRAEQCQVARTVAAAMGFSMDLAEGPALEEVFA